MHRPTHILKYMHACTHARVCIDDCVMIMQNIDDEYINNTRCVGSLVEPYLEFSLCGELEQSGWPFGWKDCVWDLWFSWGYRVRSWDRCRHQGPGLPLWWDQISTKDDMTTLLINILVSLCKDVREVLLMCKLYTHVTIRLSEQKYQILFQITF